MDNELFSSNYTFIFSQIKAIRCFQRSLANVHSQSHLPFNYRAEAPESNGLLDVKHPTTHNQYSSTTVLVILKDKGKNKSRGGTDGRLPLIGDFRSLIVE